MTIDVEKFQESNYALTVISYQMKTIFKNF